MSKYTVIEDNGGGLHLFVFRGQRVIAAYSNFEYAPGTLMSCLDALDKGDNMHTWEGAIDNPQAAYNQMTSHGHGWEIVVEGGQRKRRALHKARMGRAAQIEFGVSDDDVNAARAGAALGSRKSPRKSASSSANGKRGGRPSLRSLAAGRVDTSPSLAAHRDYIMADWPEGQDHWRWVIAAPVAEIVEWAEAGQ